MQSHTRQAQQLMQDMLRKPEKSRPLEAEEENPEAANVQNPNAFQRVQSARAPNC